MQEGGQMIPDSIKQHKPRGTEVRQKNGHFYVYRVEGWYDKVARKPKSRSLGCIGQIYEGVGFVPSRKEAGPAELMTKEYGATRLAMAVSEDIFGKLRECFPADFLRVYVMALLKLLGNLSMKDMDVAYAKSAVSMILPEVHLSRNTVSSFLGRLSLQRGGMVRFMREYASCGGGGIIFDGSSFVSGSRTNPFCGKGYSPGNAGKTQIRLLYAYDRENRVPVYFMVVPGGVSDKSAFEVALDEIGGGGFTVILDKGFFSAKNIALMDGLDFIIPLQKNTALVPDGMKSFSAYEKNIRNRFVYHKRAVYFAEVEQDRFKGCRLYVYYDCERRQYLLDGYFGRIQGEDGAVPEELTDQVIADTVGLGVSFLLTSLDITARQAYLDYKTRWEIEAMFDTHKNTLGFNMKYEASYSTQEGWAFIEFLALLVYHKINGLLVASDLVKSYNVKDVLFRASTVTQSNASGTWKVCNMTKPMMEMFGKLGVTIETLL
jgi:hypothetical protein